MLGPEHPDVATTLINMALLYRAQGRYGEAGNVNVSQEPREI